jgi:hypothetical protein
MGDPAGPSPVDSLESYPERGQIEADRPFLTSRWLLGPIALGRRRSFLVPHERTGAGSMSDAGVFAMAPRYLRGTDDMQRRSTLIVAMLLIMVLLTGVLAYQAQVAEQSHRDTAERALRAYAMTAAWNLRRDGEEALFAFLIASADSVMKRV